MDPNTSRRGFLVSAGVAVPAVSLAVAAGATAPQRDRDAGKRVVPGSPYATFSRAVTVGRLAFIAGVVGQKPGSQELASADFEPQCRQAMENLKASVEAAGSSMDRVVKCGCFLTDFADFPAFNKIYVTFFPHDPPARSTVIVKELVVPGAKLEVDCVASLD